MAQSHAEKITPGDSDDKYTVCCSNESCNDYEIKYRDFAFRFAESHREAHKDNSTVTVWHESEV